MTATMLLALAIILVTNSAMNSEKTIPQDSFSAYTETKLPELGYYQDYEALHSDAKTAVIYPIFTQSAYDWKGIHDYYTGRCDSCLSAGMHSSYEKTFSASGNGFRILEFLGYQVIDDIDVDKNPQILNKYDKIILLHNEYVTKAEFDAITSHPNVVYLYPNALRSQIEANYLDKTITLVRGPEYPTSDIKNGFDWKFDNTEYFNDWACNSWKFYPVQNGYMLNCYPEQFLPNDGHDILKAIKTLKQSGTT
jgi:hypothetical protein